MKKEFASIKAFAAILLCSGAHLAGADQAATYLQAAGQFILIKDVHRQADAWGTCSATYEIMSELVASKPAQAEQLHNLSNGASLAVVMAHVAEAISEDMTPERFNAVWSYAKTLQQSIPESMQTSILADAEALGSAGASEFIAKLDATVQVCLENLEGQQAYIDTWRELAKSGLLQFPND